MKHILFALSIFVSLVGFAQTKKVLIIGIDGCRSDAQIVANTPNMDALIATGIYSPDALNTDVTSSGPGWSANLCGVWSDKHLVSSNNFNGNNYNEYPPLFKYAEDFNPDLSTVSICHWNPINDQIVQDWADYKYNAGSDEEVLSQASTILGNNNPDLMFLHFDDIDHAGHSNGFSPDVPQYIEAIEIVDALIGQVIESVEARPNFENEDWLYLITTDHGGNGTSHGGPSMGEQNVFVIASAQNIEPFIIEKDSSYVVDNPQNCLADSVALSFDGNNDFVNIDNNDLFDFGSNQDFTIECRVRTNNAADVAIIGNKNWNTGNNPGFVFSFQYPNGPNWKMNIGDVQGNRLDLNGGGGIADNQWHSLAVSFDRDGNARLYTDGQLIQSQNMSGIGDIGSGAGLFFGTDINGAFDFNGEIAEVRVWNTAVSGETIADWFCVTADGSHPNAANLIGHWKMNEGADATEVIDYSGNNNNGLISNANWSSVADSTLVYDYDATPRLVDIPVTAMTHLCIPIEAEWDLDGNSLIPECNSELVSINGVVDWNSNCSPESMLLQFYQAGTDVLVSSQYVDVNAEGEYQFTDVQEGLYDIYVKAERFLQKGTFAVQLSELNNTVNFEGLISGDINDDNVVNILDVSLMNASFGFVDGGAGYNPAADLNCDGGVNILDISLINSSFGQSGDAP